MKKYCPLYRIYRPSYLKWICQKLHRHALDKYPYSKVNGANMGPIWVMSALDWPHVGPVNLATRVVDPQHQTPQWQSVTKPERHLLNILVRNMSQHPSSNIQLIRQNVPLMVVCLLSKQNMLAYEINFITVFVVFLIFTWTISVMDIGRMCAPHIIEYADYGPKVP